MLPTEEMTNDESLTPAQILAELIDYPPGVDDQAEKPSIMIMPIKQQQYIADTLQRQPTQEDIDLFIASWLESPDE